MNPDIKEPVAETVAPAEETKPETTDTQEAGKPEAETAEAKEETTDTDTEADVARTSQDEGADRGVGRF